MRFLAILPVVLGIAAAILSFLCLFASSDIKFLPNYPILTLNTSRIGESIFDGRLLANSRVLTGILNALPSGIKDTVEDELNQLAKDVGIADFYNIGILSWCEGKYEPVAVPTAEVPLSAITKHITGCSGRTALYQFSPRRIIQEQLDAHGVGITLDKTNWPNELDDTIDTLQTVEKASYILYCLSITAIIFASLFALVSVFFNRRFSTLLNIIFTSLAATSILLASIVITVYAYQANDRLNDKGRPVNIQSSRDGGFMALTWCAYALMAVAVIYWVSDCFVARRRRKQNLLEKTTTTT